MSRLPPSPHPTRPALRFALGLLLVALGAAAFAIVFRAALSFVVHRLGNGPDVVSAARAAPVWLRLTAPAVGGLLAGTLGLWVARAPAGQGVADVMEAVVLGRVRLAMPVTLVKSLSSWLAIASGGSLGREGPLIQFGGALGKWLSDVLALSMKRTRVLIAAGTAAGFAAAYNTPLAAVLFVLEVVVGVAALDTVVPVLVATVAASALTRAVVGEGPIYGVRAFHLASPLELLWFAGLGVFVALGAQAFMRLLSFGEHLFRHPRLVMPWRSALGGLLAGALVAVLPEVAGNGYEPLNAILDGQYGLQGVLWLLLAKCVATTASVSSGSPGGVFTPTLLLGGGLGFLYAGLLGHAGASVAAAGGYALVGMAAATAATTHAPMMAAVMAFELSGDYAIALPLLLATAIATSVSRWLRPDSVYTAELRKRGVAWHLTLDGRKREEPSRS
ncbi:MAG: chloride channel protein [Myxococcales bacterium]|nr:MAG: chloride channel protein [Myxococcales bacterium]